jgi:transcriptional coactivator HFI1/ADA1
MLPKIPFVQDKDKVAALQNKMQSQAASSSAGNGSGRSTPVAVPVATTAPHQGNPIVWTQDIIHAYDTPLAAETYELPDTDVLHTRMLGISLEHGLLQGIESQTPDVVLAALEFYLRDVIEQLYDRIKLRRSAGEDTMTAEDLAGLVDTMPNTIVEYTGPVYKLKDVMLTDEETFYPEGEEPAEEDIDQRPAKKLIRELITSQ